MKFTRKILVLCLLVLTAGCGSNQQFGLAPASLSYGQQVKYNDQVDILWVVDNSYTMERHQQRIGEQVEYFMDTLVKTRLDFRIAITSTDVGSQGHKGKFIGTKKVLTPATPNLKAEFKNNMKDVGATPGSSTERGLDAARLAFSASNLANDNKNFFRKDAMLVIIFLSDENDRSADSVSQYIDFFDNLKPDFPSGQSAWMAQFIGVLELSNECRVFNDRASVGSRYLDLVEYTKGISSSICVDDFSNALSNVRKRIVEILTEFYLEQKPDESTIKVYVNGALLKQDEENGWTYHEETKSIRFHGSGVPPADSIITIDYQPIEAKSH